MPGAAEAGGGSGWVGERAERQGAVVGGYARRHAGVAGVEGYGEGRAVRLLVVRDHLWQGEFVDKGWGEWGYY